MVSRSMQSELCLQLAIDEFVRVQLWRVRREENELNFILVFFAPSLNELRMVYAAVVANDEQLATRFAENSYLRERCSQTREHPRFLFT